MNEESFHFSTRKRKSWQKSFENVISKKNNQIFGVRISELIERDLTPIPKIIFLIGFRLNRSLHQNNAFRPSTANYFKILSLKRRFNLRLFLIKLIKILKLLLIINIIFINNQKIFLILFHK